MLLTISQPETQRIDAWLSGGRLVTFHAPTSPHFFSRSASQGGRSVPVQARLLSEMGDPRDLWRVEVHRATDVRRLSSFDSIEANVHYGERLCIDHGFLQKDQDVSLVCFDIEPRTRICSSLESIGGASPASTKQKGDYKVSIEERALRKFVESLSNEEKETIKSIFERHPTEHYLFLQILTKAVASRIQVLEDEINDLKKRVEELEKK